MFFFFQSEDGIRDRDVTGVQTCALPISPADYGLDPATTVLEMFTEFFDTPAPTVQQGSEADQTVCFGQMQFARDRKSTRLNSSHITISYAVFCLKKKKKKKKYNKTKRKKRRKHKIEKNNVEDIKKNINISTNIYNKKNN